VTEVVIYTAKDGRVELGVSLADETVWLSMNQLVRLFGRDKSAISRHLNNIFKINELEKGAVVANYATTAADGKTYQVDYYNLDAIISVGYLLTYLLYQVSPLRHHICWLSTYLLYQVSPLVSPLTPF
jgi:hypothetical protein